MPSKRSYRVYQGLPRMKTEQRLKVPQVTYRPFRFQIRSILKPELYKVSMSGLTIHRRGIGRPKIGIDPLEARAVPHYEVKGTLPERIFYKLLRDTYKLVPGWDFSFQSRLDGGRMELGGYVADFLFRFMMINVQVQGPQHNEWFWVQKDREEAMALEEMGYRVVPLWEETVYDEYALNNFTNKLLGWQHSTGGEQADVVPNATGQQFGIIDGQLQNIRNLIP